MKLRRTLCLCLGLSAAACGSDANPTSPSGGDDAGMDAQAGDNPDAGQDASRPGSARAARIVSVPPSYVVVGDPYRYRVKTSSKAAGLEMVGAPEGMEARGRMVQWTPREDQAGSHTMTVRSLGSESAANASQEITVKVSTSTLRASGDIDADQGGAVYSDSPSSPRMLGAGVYVPPRALAAGARMTVSELSQAPQTPNASGRASAVRFGPDGQAFDAPARISLPLPESSSGSNARTNVYVYTPMTGRWARVPLVSIDRLNGFAMARASHFSVYAAIESKIDLQLQVAPTANDSACPDGMIAHAQVASPLNEIELASLNNLPETVRASVPGEAPTIQDLLALPGFTGSLRAVQAFELVQRAGDGELVRETELVATTLYLAPDGSATITHSDALGNVLGKLSYPQPLLKLDEIAARLRGAATAVEFATPPGQDIGVGARLHLIYFAGDAADEPLNADDLGVAAVERAPFGESVASLSDGDCDGLVDAYDGSDDRLVAGVEASPRGVVSLLAGDTVKLSARVVHGTASAETWTVLDGEGATLTTVEGGRSFTASAADRYLVSYRAKVGEQTLEHIFAIDVEQAPADNTPPTCRPVRDLDVGRVGDGFTLSALLDDAETPASALRVEWGLVDGQNLVESGTIRAFQGKALFAPLDAGNFTIGCRAYDGASWGPVGRVGASIVARNQNRAPTDLTLSPTVRVANVGDVITFRASARDPDGDPLLFTWYVDGNPSATHASVNEASFSYTADHEGAIKVTAEVMDGSAQPVRAEARLVVGAAPTSDVDADKDGWNAGSGPAADCDDSKYDIHPGAFDLCGDEIDADCDGKIQKDDCDGDLWTIARGDCDDTNPNIYPQQDERLCDGVDNNCNQQIDEGFFVGTACRAGVGACMATGTIACSTDGASSVCSAQPPKGSAEVCDDIDNDCDGSTDEDDVCQDAGTPDASVPLDATVVVTADSAVGACVPGPEDCNNDKDDDCDELVDYNDPDCAQGTPGDNCTNPARIGLDQWINGYFDGAKPDLNSCTDGRADLVFAFTVKDEGEYVVTTGGSPVTGWSIQSGACDPDKISLRELSCNKPAQLSPGNYFLVIEGPDKGPYSLYLSLQYPK